MNTDKLANAGINYKEGVSRFADKADIYEQYLKKFADDATFKMLGDALAANDAAAAFPLAHTLYGTVANLSIMSLAPDLHIIVETLRKGSLDGVMPLYENLNRQYAAVINAIKDK